MKRLEARGKVSLEIQGLRIGDSGMHTPSPRLDGPFNIHKCTNKVDTDERASAISY